MKASPKIFITGGHSTPAKAMIDIFLKKQWKIWYIGRKFAQEEDNSISVEYQTLKSYSPYVQFLVIYTGKIQRYLSFKSFISFFKIPLGFVQSIYWLIRYRPNIILSFGGYVSFPVCIAGKIFGVSVIIHEQTRVMGIANKLLNSMSDKVCRSWKNLGEALGSDKLVYTGLPLRRSIFRSEKSLTIVLDRPLIYITGGSLGSHIINILFEPIISKLLKDFAIIQQCGETLKYSDYERLIKLKENLPTNLRERYLPITYIQEKNLGWVYQKIAFVIGRSGANTVYELAALGIPALFIPLPFASGNEQLVNAKFFKDNGAGEILEQDNLTPEKLYAEILIFSKKISQYKENAQKLKTKITLAGSENLLKVIENYINETKYN